MKENYNEDYSIYVFNLINTLIFMFSAIAHGVACVL